MCPLRVILIFLSATIAGFFLLRGLNAEPDLFQDDAAAAVAGNDDDDDEGSPREPAPLHSKVLLLSCCCLFPISPHICAIVAANSWPCVLFIIYKDYLGLCNISTTTSNEIMPVSCAG
uniref:Predicted protein n=1 Tax=Hordeum vulgare subsp. vulgare TaxID=112509 RepID=F2DS07_HORVV|nr:predicted protein [Hordeum vulgare subsp. vulgare]